MKRKKLFLIILIMISFFILVFNYDNILKWRYNNAIKNKDCEKLYNIVDIENGKYLTKEKYIEQCKLKINNYNNHEIQVKNHKIKNKIVSVYNNITFYVPSDSDFYLDNKLVSDDFISDENNIYKIFTINKLYEGEYSIVFKNAKNEENEIINISETGLEKRFEYNNNKQTVTVIGHNLCRFCTELLSFLSTVDNNIVDVKYYNIYDNGKSEYKKESERVLNEFSQYFKTNIEFYPTVIIGNKYILGFNESKESEYINSIYHSYRNEIETVIK